MAHKTSLSKETEKIYDESTEKEERANSMEKPQKTMGLPLENVMKGISKVGIWGLQGSGKTTYAISLVEAMEQRGWNVQPVNETLDIYFKEYNRLEEGNYPPPTSMSRLLEFRFAKSNSLLKKGTFNTVGIPDIPGKAYVDEPIIVDYLSECDGVVFLIDPEKKWRGDDSPYGGTIKNVHPIILKVLEQIRQNQNALKIESYIAFCVTKMDIYRSLDFLPEDDPRRNNPCGWEEDNPLDVAVNILGEKAVTAIENRIQPNKLKWFTCSAVDCVQIEEEGGSKKMVSQHLLESVDGKEQKIGKIRVPRERRPKRVEEPVDWILRNL